VSLFATFETGVGAAQVCSVVVGKLSELRRLSLGFEGGHVQGIQLHRFTTGVFLVGRLQGDEGWSMIDDGIEAVCNSTGFFKGLMVSKFDFRACLGFQSVNELIDKSLFFDFSELYCELC
jgi:hypothetical protein